MPKADRFAQARKEAAKTAKSLAAEKKAKQKAFEEGEAEAAYAHPASREAAGAQQKVSNGTKSSGAPLKGTVKANSAFAKASRFDAPDDDEEDDADEYEEAPAASVSAPSASSSKKAEKKSKAKANGHGDDMMLLEEQERAARKQRVLTRFLNILLIGVVLDWWRDRPAAKDGGKPAKPKSSPNKGGKKGDRDVGGGLESMREKAGSLLGGPFLLFAFTVGLFAVRAFEEGYDPDVRGEEHVNYYDAMGIPRDSDIKAVRKAYKSLALSWHPDKNPGCRECPSRFAVISEAYETLSDPEKKKAYDLQRAHSGSLESMASVELTTENFERLVLRSNEVWIVQVYSPSDYASKDFHAIWEDVALSHQQVARWGRIDSSKHRVAEFLPQRAVVLPVVYRFARGLEPEFFTWNGDRDTGSGPLARFLADTYPATKSVGGGEIRGWLDGGAGRARAVLASRGPLPTSGKRAMDTLLFRRVAHMWAEFVDVATADAADVEKVLGASASSAGIAGIAKGDSYVLLSRTAGEAALDRRSFNELEDASSAFQQMVAGAIGAQAPHVTLRNHHQLCSAAGLGLVTRSYCVMLVDSGDSEALAAMSEVNQSRVAYAQELVELQSASEDGGDEEPQEPLHIQLVRVSTGTSRLPWLPAGAGVAFASLWQEVKYAPVFVLELETRRAAAVKSKSLGEIFQQIAYEDLRLSELSEDLPLTKVWADPERTMRRELLLALSTKLGAALALVLFAAGAAVAPELSLATSGAAISALLMTLLISWPGLCRRVLLPLCNSGVVQC